MQAKSNAARESSSSARPIRLHEGDEARQDDVQVQKANFPDQQDVEESM
jgi:hypothetical protein